MMKAEVSIITVILSILQTSLDEFSSQDQFCPFWDQFCGFAYIIRLGDHFCGRTGLRSPFHSLVVKWSISVIENKTYQSIDNVGTETAFCLSNIAL